MCKRSRWPSPIYEIYAKLWYSSNLEHKKTLLGNNKNQDLSCPVGDNLSLIFKGDQSKIDSCGFES